MTGSESEKMITFTIDGREVRARATDNILRAALDHDIHIPYYCWHPALSVVASCRMCLVEIDTQDTKTGELKRNPKLVPACRTPVQEGIRVWTNTEKVIANQKACMEFYLLNHPLDCPVCDKAGECLLQDYSYRYGNAMSRMIDQKTKQPKKDLSENILLYSDRCILCSRCVRFTREISGGAELAVVNRANLSEIDQVPGQTLDDELAGNVVDICPVGSLLDKYFLFRERVWYLKADPSVCAGCASGCTMYVDHRDEKLDRFRPRYNPKVNDYWMCDIGRFLWKQVFREDRLRRYRFGTAQVQASELPDILRNQLTAFVGRNGAGKFGVVLSPMLDCELLYILCRVIRDLDPRAVLIAGPEINAGEDKKFKSGFTISADRTPNAAGVKMILDKFAGNQMEFKGLSDHPLQGLWITGGYVHAPLDSLIHLTGKPELLIVQDSFETKLSKIADLLLPMTLWVEREGTFINRNGLRQPFARGVLPPCGLIQEGQWMGRLIGKKGVYYAAHIRAELALMFGGFDLYEPPKLPASMHF
jgi:NADH-quinone oxidoreductase subunit G